ncbi:response regulator [Roseateles chitinivorans]|uniref:response regulator n=1 Tax=Roseateles chitinivorans TaxID=2917965 RepID=UPI003D66F2DF
MSLGEVVEESASRAQQRLAFGLSAVLLAAAAALTPYASTPLPELSHISGMYGAAVAMINLATFWLLVSAPAQTRAHSAIAAAYLFAGLMAVLHVLTFPGAVLQSQPVLGSPHAVSWLFIVWRAGFALFVGWAAWRGEVATSRSPVDGSWPVVLAVLATVLAAVASQCTDAAAITLAGGRQLFSTFSIYGSYAAGAIAVLAVALIWRRGLYRRSIFVWLVFVMTAEAAGVWLSTFSGGRYTIAWYGARIEGVLVSAVMLLVLAQHFRRLQHRLANSVDALRYRTERLQAEILRRERLEAQLAQAEKLKAVGQLGASLAHDLNNILQVITGRLSILQRRVGAAADADVEVIRRNVRKAEVLTRQLTSLSGRRHFLAQSVDMIAALQGTAEAARLLLDAHHKLLLEVPDELPPLTLDALEFEVAVTNLVTNARDAMPDGGMVTIRAFLGARAASPTLVVEVSDTGVGIRPEIREHIFEPFFSTKEPGKGTGLGLAQVAAFTGKSHGRVELRSVMGEGTTVALAFSLAPGAMSPTAGPSSTGGVVHTATLAAGDVVLLVDDNDDVREASAQLLEAGGFVVMAARSAREALAFINDGFTPHVVISDIVMPGGMHGVELVRQIRQRHPQVKSVLVTGHSDVAEGARREGVAVIPKPYDMQTLLRALG